LGGWGATNFSTTTDVLVLTGFVNSALIRNPATRPVPSSTPEKRSKTSVASEPEYRRIQSSALCQV
jgi:hypothetical protein